MENMAPRVVKRFQYSEYKIGQVGRSSNGEGQCHQERDVSDPAR